MVVKPVKRLLLNKLRIINDSLRIIASNAGNEDENVTIRVYSSTTNLTRHLLLPAGHFNEWFINKIGFDKNVYALLFNNDLLISEEGLMINNTREQGLIINNESVTKLTINNSPLTINHSINSNETINQLTGHFIITENSMEILLYSSIVIVSLTTLYVVLSKL